MEKKIYKEKELAAFAGVFAEAEALWAGKITEYVKANGDRGSCVLGAGFEVAYLPKGCRKPQYKRVVRPFGPAQGSICWEDSKDEIAAFLAAKGVEAHYAWGNMD